MASAGSVFSQTLQDITNTKLEELEKKRHDFQEHHQNISNIAQSDQNPVEKLGKLAEEIKTCFSIPTSGGRVTRGSTNNPSLEIDLKNIERFLGQARYDPSVSSKLVDKWQQSLLRHLDVQSLKYVYADLYGKMTTEWLSVKQQAATVSQGEDIEMEGFENVSGGKRMESRHNWERSVFEPTDIDQPAVSKMLRNLFEATPEGSKHLLRAMKALRERTTEFERELSSTSCFTIHSLGWTMSGLLASDLLTEEKRTVLRDMKNNEVILKEIADVLNMRIGALHAWSWGYEVQLEERRQLNGSFNIYMHEDLLQAIFLQCIGVRWSVFWKQNFVKFRKSKQVWKTPRTSIPLNDKKRRDFYLGPTSKRPNVTSKKQGLYRKDYFLSQLQESVYQEISAEEGDEEAEMDDDVVASQQPLKRQRTKQSARKATSGQAPRRQLASMAVQPLAAGSSGLRNHSMSRRDDENDGSDSEFEPEDDENYGNAMKNPMEAKQTLLQLLSTEILIKSRLHGEVTCFRSQVDNLYPSLPHATVESVLEFFGVSRKWTEFFKSFLQAPLRFMDDRSSEPRQRRQGTPGSHVLSDVFSEIVLFCLDFEINQVTDGEPLWRLQDSFWFWSSEHAVCVKAWSSISKFMKTMGLTLDDARTGSARMLRKKDEPDRLIPVDDKGKLPRGQIRWGMLYLNPETGRFDIDQDMVDKHIDELSRQLEKQSNSVFAWIQAWNTYASTFFTSNFGKPANCFGRQHVDHMLATHERIQRQIFSSTNTSGAGFEEAGSSVIEHLKQTIDKRFGIKDIPDGYFFFPTELGGLEVKSPFIGLLQIRESVEARPMKLLDDFEEAERESYLRAKRHFETGITQEYLMYVADPKFRPKDPETFFPLEEYVKYREELNYGFDGELVDVLTKLLKRPDEESIDCYENGEVMASLNALSRQSDLRGILSSWNSMQPYWRWVAALHGPEMIDKFGGFSIVDPGLLPMGMVSLFRSGRVKWQE